MMKGAAVGIGRYRDGKAEKSGRGAADDLFNRIIGQAPDVSASSMISPGIKPTSTGKGGTAPTAAPPAVDISGSKAEFVNALLPAAIEESKRTGVDPRIIVAQAAQETGWGKSAPGNNFFGIKSHGKGGGQSLNTHEYVNGKRVNVKDSFRTFGSPGESVRGYGDFILENPRYKGLREAQGLDAQLAALQASGYATDPNYSSSVGAIARGIQLPQEVASLDPSIGMPPQTSAEAVNAMAAGGGAVIADESQYSPEDRERLATLRGAPPSAIPYSGPGARIDTPTAVYDDKGFRMEGGGQQPPPSSLSDEVAAFEQTPEYRAQFPGRAGAPQTVAPPPQGAPQGIPPQFQGSQQLANAQGGIMPALMDGSPASPEQVAQAQAMGQQQTPPQQAPQQAPAQARPDKMALLQALSNPWLSQEQKAVLQTLYQQQEQEEQAAREQQIWMQRQQYEQEAKRNDPAYQIGLEKSRIDLEDAKKPKRQPLINAGNGNVYDPNEDKWLTAPSGSGDGSFRFNGNSVEAQALNGLMESGQLTPEQAQQLAAGKTISGPNGEIIFLTPQGVFGQSSAGGQPQQISGSQPASNQPPQQQMQPQTQMPGQTPPGGNIQITPPKVTVDEKEAATFADRMNTSGGLIDQFEGAGLGVWDQAVRGNDYIPDFLENWMVSDDFQNFDQARRDFINAQLRRESGAVISMEEFDNANKQYFPQPGDTREVLEQKRRNRQTVVDGMKRSAGPTYGRSNNDGADPLGIR
ncbi:glycoside hydrolase family 73 protein [Sinorhizobium medicae]